MIQSLGANYPTSREGHTFTYVEPLKQYFLFGGISSKRSNELFVYDASNFLRFNNYEIRQQQLEFD